MKLLTPFNFLRWYQDAAESFTPVPRLYERVTMCTPALVFTPGETYTFYVNRLDNQAISGTVELWRGTSKVQNLTASYTPVPLKAGSHSILSVTCPNIVPGTYYLKCSGLTSSPIEIMPADEAALFSIMVAFRHDTLFAHVPPIFYYPYVDDALGNANFKQEFRLRLTQVNLETSGEQAVYEESRSGASRALGGTEREYVGFRGPRYVIEDFQALRAMVKHDFLTIGDKRFKFNPQGVPRLAYSLDMNAHTVEFSLEDPAHTLLLRC